MCISRGPKCDPAAPPPLHPYKIRECYVELYVLRAVKMV